MNQRGDNSSSNKKESPRNARQITGKELKYYEEIRTQASTLVEILDEKGIRERRERDLNPFPLLMGSLLT